MGILPMAELLTSIATLAIVVIGIAIVLQMTSIQDVLGFIGRAVAAVVVIVLALCFLKCLWVGVMAPWISTAFDFLKTLVGWFVIGILIVTALLLVGRVALRQAGRYLTLRRDPLTGDGYGKDSKDTED